MAAWMASVTATQKSAAAEEAAKETAKLDAIGVLAKRPASIPRGERGLRILLARYLDGSMSQSEKKKGVSAEQQHLLKRMEEITVDIVGREKDEGTGLTEIKPKLVTTFNLRKSEVAKLAAMKDKVQLHEEKGKPGERMCVLSEELYGKTSILKLSKLPADGKGGTIGDLIRLHAESKQPWLVAFPCGLCSLVLPLMCPCISWCAVSTWMREESDHTRVGTDIIQDRLSFAAHALPHVALLRDKYISLATQLSTVRKDTQRAYDKEMAAQGASAQGRRGAAPPTAKRAATSGEAQATSADGTGGAGGSMRRVRTLKAWNASKQESRREATDNTVYVSVETSEVVTMVSEADPWVVVEKEDGSRGHVPMALASGGPRFEDVAEEASAPAAPVLSSDDEAPVEVHGERGHGDEMTDDMVGRTTPPEADEPVADDLTPGRPGAPILIDQAAIGEWAPHEHLKYASLIAGEHKGSILWWDGAEMYQLADGRVARIRSE